MTTSLTETELMEQARILQERGVFLGGPYRKFAAAGRNQLEVLVEQGLQPSSRVLDVGCGCLRAGVWLIDHLEPGRYFGIEPNASMLEAGIDVLLTPEQIEAKRPRFDTNDQFRFDVFGVEFDFVLARSIWTHATRSQITAMVDQFAATGAAHARFLTSIVRCPWYRRQSDPPEWVGLSHEGGPAGIVRYRVSWIRQICAERGLEVRSLGRQLGQDWLRISRASPT